MSSLSHIQIIENYVQDRAAGKDVIEYFTIDSPTIVSKNYTYIGVESIKKYYEANPPPIISLDVKDLHQKEDGSVELRLCIPYIGTTMATANFVLNSVGKIVKLTIS